MNPLNLFWKRIFVGFFVFIGLSLSHIVIAGDPGLKTKNLQDSLKILDKLVKANRINNPDLALHYSKRSVAISQRLHDPKALINAYVQMGWSFMQSYKDSTFIYYSKALNIADSLDILSEKPKILYDIAIIYSDAQDYQRAMEKLDSCTILAESIKDYSSLTDAYNLLGNIRFRINDTASAFQLYQKAFSIAQENVSKDSSLYRQMGNAFSNLAKNEKDIRKSISMQQKAINYLKQTKGTEEEVAYIYINLAYLLSNPDSAIYFYRKALTIAQKGNFWEIGIGALNNMAYSYLDKKDIVNAEKCIKDAIPLALKLKSPDWLSELYDSYAEILTSKGDFNQAYNYQKMALNSRIEADVKQASSQLRLLAVLMDVKNKELQIKNKEKELLIQKGRLRNAQLWLAISALVIIGFVFIILWLQQRYRMRLQNEQINSAKRIIEMEENEKGKTARELHDITGQLVMGITGEIENIEFPDNKSKEQLEGKIKELGKSIRLISHRMNRAMMEHFSFEELIEGQCHDVQKLTGIPIHVKIPEGQLTLPPEVILHTYRMVQELLTNASKYIKGHQVWIHIIRESNGFILTYKDDGPGFDTEKVTKTGMGLSNIFERAKLLGGQALVTSSKESGTQWKITIPFHKKN